MRDQPHFDRHNMFESLLEADPAFTPEWERFLQEWDDETELPLYLALSALARHLISQLAKGATQSFDGVFNVIEQWHCYGDEYVREAATVGLLEDLQNTNLHDRTAPDDFERWLRPASRKWWDKVERFWADGQPLAD